MSIYDIWNSSNIWQTIIHADLTPLFIFALIIIGLVVVAVIAVVIGALIRSARKRWSWFDVSCAFIADRRIGISTTFVISLPVIVIALAISSS